MDFLRRHTFYIISALAGGAGIALAATGFMAMPEVDGALVGGASLKPDFVELVRRAAPGQ